MRKRELLCWLIGATRSFEQGGRTWILINCAISQGLGRNVKDRKCGALKNLGCELGERKAAVNDRTRCKKKEILRISFALVSSPIALARLSCLGGYTRNNKCQVITWFCLLGDIG